MDGVIVDSNPHHLRAWTEYMDGHGFELTWPQFRAWAGRRGGEILHEHFNGRFSADEIVSELGRIDERYPTLISEKVVPIPGVLAFLDHLAKRGVPVAVASSGPRINVELILDKLGLSRRFGAVITSGDVTKGKPDPEIFLTAAARLGADPAECWVIEDATTGVRAAKAAQMRCLALTTTCDPAELLASGADRLRADFVGLTLDDLETTDA